MPDTNGRRWSRGEGRAGGLVRELAQRLSDLPESPAELNAGPLVTNRRSIAGTKNGGIAETQQMLDFCAEHGLTADIEVIPDDQINDAYERVIGCDVRYRFVIDTPTIG